MHLLVLGYKAIGSYHLTSLKLQVLGMEPFPEQVRALCHVWNS